MRRERGYFAITLRNALVKFECLLVESGFAGIGLVATVGARETRFDIDR